MKPEVRGWVSALGDAGGTGAQVGQVLGGPRGMLLATFAEWLVEEGIPAGLLSPSEGDRISNRHIEDSLSFLVGWPAAPPETLLDVGSGGGLPGIPLAIVLAHTQVTLLERSKKRSGLLRRAVRVLNLGNVEVVEGDLEELNQREAIVMRGVLPPSLGVPWMRQTLMPGGTGVIALSRRKAPDPAWSELEGTVAEVSVLDPPGWLLIIRERGH